LSVEFKPFSLREIGRIEETIPPMRIIVTACTNENHHQSRVQACLPAGRDSRVHGFKGLYSEIFTGTLGPLTP
jgi:hypothetical protein